MKTLFPFSTKTFILCKTITILSLFALISCNEEECKKPENANHELCQGVGTDPEPTDPTTGSSGNESNASIAEDVLGDVDDYYGNYGGELLTTRDNRNAHFTDSCQKTGNTMGETIVHYVEEFIKDERTLPFHVVGELFDMPSSRSNQVKVGIASHKLCEHSSSTLKTTILNPPDSQTISLINRFAREHNSYRSKYKAGNKKALADLKKHWSKFYGCLAYVESLTTADTSRSYDVSEKYAPSGYRKPAGIKFYEDPRQPLESRLNIGMYQFTPTASGNIHICHMAWGERYSSCKINDKSFGEMIKIVGSSKQHFNTFCGVQQLLINFSVQANSYASKRTHPSNYVNGSLKSSDSRCVTPHFNGKAYNHFGPFQNSSGNNTKELYQCIYNQ